MVKNILKIFQNFCEQYKIIDSFYSAKCEIYIIFQFELTVCNDSWHHVLYILFQQKSFWIFKYLNILGAYDLCIKLTCIQIHMYIYEL